MITSRPKLINPLTIIQILHYQKATIFYSLREVHVNIKWQGSYHLQNYLVGSTTNGLFRYPNVSLDNNVLLIYLVLYMHQQNISNYPQILLVRLYTLISLICLLQISLIREKNMTEFRVENNIVIAYTKQHYAQTLRKITKFQNYKNSSNKER